MDKRTKEKWILIVLLLNIIQTIGANEDCEKDVIHVRGKRHKKVVWAKDIDRPYHLAYYKHKDIVFYSYNIGIDEEDTFKIAYVHKHHNKHTPLEIDNGFATAIDEENHFVFLGGNLGIYKYHPDKSNSKIEKIVRNQNIWYMFFKKELYYIKFPTQQLYRFNVHNRGSKPERVHDIHENIYQYAIDGNHDQFFTNDTGLFKIKNGTNDRIRYHGEHVFRGMAIDKKGDIIFCGKHGIFEASKDNHTLEEIAHIRNIFGITFDSDDNIVYSNAHEIVTILPEDPCEKKSKN